MFMIFRPSGRDHDSPNRLFLILNAPNDFKQFKKNGTIFENIMFRNLKIFEIEHLVSFGKDARFFSFRT